VYIRSGIGNCDLGIKKVSKTKKLENMRKCYMIHYVQGPSLTSILHMILV
jgi:hypothetical protein